MVTFTSSSTVTNFLKLVQEKGLSDRLQEVAVASIGPITSKTIREHGLEVSIEAKESTVPGLVQAIHDYFARSSNR